MGETYSYKINYANICFSEDKTLYAEDFSDAYHAKGQAVEEAEYVYIKGCKIQENWKNSFNYTIAEFGFGSAINFLCTWKVYESDPDRPSNLNYISFEKFPIKVEQLKEILAVYPSLKKYSNLLLKQYEHLNQGLNFISFGELAPRLSLYIGDIREELPKISSPVDAWYFDGFSPAKNPEMWSSEIISLAKKNSHQATTFSSFSAASIFKNSLKENLATFTKAKGFGNKRDMLEGVINGDNKKSIESKRIAIIGSGLAGSFLAYYLAKRKHEVVIFESKQEIAARASGNIMGIFRPDFVKKPKYRHQFYHTAYMHMLRWLLLMERFWEEFSCELNGSYRFLSDHQLKKLYHKFPIELEDFKYLKKLSQEEVESLFATKTSEPAFFLPFSGKLSPKKLCEFLFRISGVELRLSSPVLALMDKGSCWQLKLNSSSEEFDTVILANAHEAGELLPDLVDALEKNKGQLAYLDKDLKLNCKSPLCFGGYLVESQDERLVLGASYEHDVDNLDCTEEEFFKLSRKFNKYFPELEINKNNYLGGRAEFRTYTEDKLPLFEEYKKNLFLSLAHGSKGITTAAYVAEILASKIST